MKKKEAAEVAREAAREAVDQFTFETREYANVTFSTLTIHFAEGSDPRSLSIPYQRFANRAEVSVPYRLVKVEE